MSQRPPHRQFRSMALATLVLGLSQAGLAAGDTVTLFEIVRIFDGTGSQLFAPANALRSSVGDCPTGDFLAHLRRSAETSRQG